MASTNVCTSTIESHAVTRPNSLGDIYFFQMTEGKTWGRDQIAAIRHEAAVIDQHASSITAYYARHRNLSECNLPGLSTGGKVNLEEVLSRTANYLL